jgi:hypothetical protein
VGLPKYRDFDHRIGRWDLQESFAIYDASRKVWHQTWVIYSGQLLVIEGQALDGVITLSGAEHLPSGKRLVKGARQMIKKGRARNRFKVHR